MIKIAIITPAYKDNTFIKRGLDTLKNQTKRENIVLYFVNDCSPNTNCEYQDIIQEYSQYFEIKYFKTETNVGPGLARQLALDQVTEDYILLHDDDDYFYDEYVIENCINAIEKNKDKKMAIISFSFIVQVDKEKTEIQTGDTQHWNFLANLYYTNFLREYNIRMNEKLTYGGEDIYFTFLTPLYASIGKYNITYEKNTFITVLYHDNSYTSLTYTDESHKKEKNKLYQKNFFFNIIEQAEFISMYRDIISKYRKITKGEYDDIISLLKCFYKYCNNIFYFLEQFETLPFTKKDGKNFQDAVFLFLDMIEKNKDIIENEIQQEVNLEPPTSEVYPVIFFNYFKETIEQRCQKIVEKCQK